MRSVRLVWAVFAIGMLSPYPVQAGLPAMPEIPVTLPDEVRQPLIDKRAPLAKQKLALIEIGKSINEDCKKVEKGSAQHEQCLARQKEFAEQVETLRGSMSGLAREIDGAIEADRRRRVPLYDTSVVDARVPRDGAELIAKVPELASSPAADRIMKGFQAVMNHDWPVALAWWQDALQRDPGNAALKRSVDLAQWMVEQRKTAPTSAPSAFADALHAASAGDYAEAIRQFKLAKAQNPALTPHVDPMIAEIERKAYEAMMRAQKKREFEDELQVMVYKMYERGMLRMVVGDDSGAQEAMQAAEFYSNWLPFAKQPWSGKAP